MKFNYKDFIFANPRIDARVYVEKVTEEQTWAQIYDDTYEPATIEIDQLSNAITAELKSILV